MKRCVCHISDVNMEVIITDACWLKLVLGCICLLKLVVSQNMDTGEPLQVMDTGEHLQIMDTDEPLQIMDTDEPLLSESSSVQFLNPPHDLVAGYLLQVLYHCERNQVVNVEVLASSSLKTAVPVFKKRWACSPGVSKKLRKVRLDLPDQIVYREDYFIKHSIVVSYVTLRAWITDDSLASDQSESSYASAMAKTLHHIQPMPPYSRPHKDQRHSLRWDQQLVWQMTKNKLPQCPVEQETVYILPFVFASTGEKFGITKKFSPYSDSILETRRQKDITTPRSTFCIWLYLLQHCSERFCGLLYQLDWNQKYDSPALLLTSAGYVHVQMVLTSRQAVAFQSSFTVPLHEWCLLELRLDGALANLKLVCEEQAAKYNLQEVVIAVVTSLTPLSASGCTCSSTVRRGSVAFCTTGLESEIRLSCSLADQCGYVTRADGADFPTGRSVPSSFTVPLHDWCLLELRLDGALANLKLVCEEQQQSTIYKFIENVLLDDTHGHFVLGGSNFVSGINGFMGPTVYYRNRLRAPTQLSSKDPQSEMAEQFFHVNFAVKAESQDSESMLPDLIKSLDFSRWFAKCSIFQEECLERLEVYKLEAESLEPEKTCGTVYWDYTIRYSDIPPGPQCSVWEAPPPPRRATVSKLLKAMVLEQGVRLLKHELLGLELFRTFEKRVTGRGGTARIRKLIPLLLQAGCLGFHRAYFLTSVLYQTGFGLKIDHIKALRYVLIAAQADERLSQMYLGHKHHLGVDGFPMDHDLSYAYYSNIAKQTMEDRLQPSRNQSFVEYVRLTDEEALKVQTKENAHLFIWLRYQARQGVSSAQQAVSRMLFWGQQGITPNMKAAVKLYEKGAIQLKDPVLMYDYGIVLLRGQGVQQDIPKALELLKKAADQNFAPAINSLGWYYEKYEKDYQQAVEYWEKADALGHSEAPFNLGVLHSHGLIPGKEKDDFTAYQYYWKSARRGHVDGAVNLAAYWIQGIPGSVPRLPLNAVEWTKWASEKNGYLGAVLRKSLDGYIQRAWSKTLLQYLQAAEAGFEVAQFNMAYLCEQDPEGLISRHMQTDCVWKYYNLSAHSDRPPSYAQIKMGDLLYMAHPKRKRDLQAAMRLYTAAALQEDPQGLYSLGILVENGVSLPFSTLKKLGLNSSISANNFTIRTELYKRCRDHEKDASYISCSLALLNTHLQYIWTFHRSIVQCSSAAALTILTALSVMAVLSRLQNGGLRMQHSV
ncbi:protein sel-1 homolog 3 [Microcaecilia unicolor]|uniref:Protein sel-1 homolog 3-like n=1 Tax=Microcaecilia unicolor TaxID=1415580 RepID=A0A6P7XYN0_9AMPH|nr:protein sel-1 homolog 3-like [Microcaecilia unicolor]